MAYLKTTIVQTSIDWHSAKSNCQRIESLLSEQKLETDLIVLPEMFNSGYSMQPQKIAESMNGDTIKWMKKTAKRYSAAICGSLVISEDNQYFNRLVWITPNGEENGYDKRHLFSLAGEPSFYSAGTNQGIWDYKGWKICTRICYDLRFPVWCRNTQDYDLIIFVANWPQPRNKAWQTLLKARAMENMSYCIGVNRIGKDPNGLNYLGYSAVHDALGERMTPKMIEKETMATIELDREKLNSLRNQLGFLKDRDRFEIY
ncbi:MAG: nitrilase family protein [Flavobacteriaceae bacterium]|nr:nitrilase family protein [Flavobacteriaceae bacterium]MCY4253374.1 nitrilase family protein [Flavobacteriaceae bacterium]